MITSSETQYNRIRRFRNRQNKISVEYYSHVKKDKVKTCTTWGFYLYILIYILDPCFHTQMQPFKTHKTWIQILCWRGIARVPVLVCLLLTLASKVACDQLRFSWHRLATCCSFCLRPALLIRVDAANCFSPVLYYYFIIPLHLFTYWKPFNYQSVQLKDIVVSPHLYLLNFNIFLFLGFTLYYILVFIPDFVFYGSVNFFDDGLSLLCNMKGIKDITSHSVSLLSCPCLVSSSGPSLSTVQFS